MEEPADPKELSTQHAEPVEEEQKKIEIIEQKTEAKEEQKVELLSRAQLMDQRRQARFRP